MELVQQPDKRPTNKLVAAGAVMPGAAGALVWLARVVFDVEVPAEVAVWATGAIGSLFAYFFVRDRANVPG